MREKTDTRIVHVRGDYFNPFQPLSDKALTEYWTEQMPVSDMSLQWTMPIRGDKKLAQTRGNMSIASQDAKPEWLNKQAYHAFCNLRAYPLQQMRKLLIALEESSLPMTRRAVQHLLRQCMHQVGPLNDNQFHWKKDIESLMMDFEKVLLARVDESVEKPRAHEAFPVLADLLNYFIQWAEDPMPLIKGCRKLSTAALKWARETLDQMQYHGPESQDAMHAKVGASAAIALLTFMFGFTEMYLKNTGHGIHDSYLVFFKSEKSKGYLSLSMVSLSISTYFFLSL